MPTAYLLMLADNKKIEQPRETIEDSEIPLSEIYNTIHRQIIGLAFSMAFYNLHQSLQKLEEKPLVITIGGLQYTGNKEALKITYLLEQKYWTKFLNLPIDDFENFFIQKSTLDIFANASPSENFSSGNSKEEEKISKVSSFEDFYSYLAPWKEEDQEEEDPKEEISNPEEEKKKFREAPDLEEEDENEELEKF